MSETRASDAVWPRDAAKEAAITLRSPVVSSVKPGFTNLVD